jgi:hypothetical protein
MNNCACCIHLNIEHDTGFEYCDIPEYSEDQRPEDNCPDYITEMDAKADAKYRDEDRY